MTPGGVHRLVLLAILVMVGATPSLAQERIYVGQRNPSQVRGFTFDGTSFARIDINPAASQDTIPSGVEAQDLVATDRLLLSRSAFGPVNLITLDPATASEFPRLSCCGGTVQSTRSSIPSADGQFMFILAADGVSMKLWTVDLRIGSPQFLSVVAPVVSLGFDGTTNATAAALNEAGTRLFVAVRKSAPLAVQFVTVDVTNPLAPVLGPTTVAQVPDSTAPAFEGDATRMVVVESAGEQFLLVARRSLQVYRVESNGTLTFIQSIDSTSPAAGNRQRTVRDVVLFGTLGYAVTDVDPAATGVEELLVLNMVREGPGFNGAVLSTRALGTPSTFDQDRIALMGNGAYLAVLDRGDGTGAGAPARLLAYNRALLDSGGDGKLAVTPIDPDPAIGTSAAGMVIRGPFPANTPSITSVNVLNAATNILVNDQPRDIEINGSNLESTSYAAVGLTPVSLLSVTGSRIVARVPAQVPSSLAPVLVAGALGTAKGSVRIANAPDRQAPFLVFGVGNASDEIAQINSASTTDVVSTFPTGLGPDGASISPDGRLLITGEFTGNRLLIHSLVNDPARQWQRFQILKAPGVGGQPQRHAIHPTRPRAYTGSLQDRTISTIDLDPNSPAFGTEVAPRISTAASDATVAQPRGLTVTPDGRYLIATRAAAPHLVFVDVQDDNHEVSFTTLPIGGLTGRADGLAVHPNNTTLYYSIQSDNGIRVFDISNITAPVQIAHIPFSGGAADTRRIVVSPNGLRVYVASRGRATLDVIDTATNQVIATIPTGPFSGDLSVSPDNAFVFVGVGATDSVLTVDVRATVNGAPNPALHTIVASSAGGRGTASATVYPGLQTPASGTPQTVEPLPGASLTFNNVTTPGNTTVTVSQVSTRNLDSDYQLAGTPLFYDIRTTATFVGSITVCLSYSGVPAADESQLRLLHEENGAFRDVTTSVDTVADRVCGVVTSLSPFAIAKRVAQDSAPTNPRYPAVAIAGSTITIGWTPPVGGGVPTTYIIEGDLGANTFDISVSTGSTSTQFVVPGVPPGTYSVRVRAQNSLGVSAPSEAIRFSVGAPVAQAGAVLALVGSASPQQSVALSWQPPSSGGPVQGYALSVGSAPGLADIATILGPSNVTSLAAAGVPTGLYFVRVRAFNAAGVGPSSNEVLLAVGAVSCVAAPAPPTFAASFSGGLANLSWTTPPGSVTSYLLEAGTVSGLANIATIPLPTQPTAVSAAAPSGTYFLRLRAVNQCGPSGASNEVVLPIP